MAWGSDNQSDNSSSAVSSSDESFLAAEADFASAVAKAAELSGLTVVGSTVSDPNAGKEKGREKDLRLCLFFGLFLNIKFSSELTRTLKIPN